MKIGTWNLDAQWSEAHRELLVEEQCDVWLLTEVSPVSQNTDGTIAGYHCHLSKGVMARGQHWAAVLSLKPLSRLSDPHEASAAARVNGVTYCSTVLPWAGCTTLKPHPWGSGTLDDMARPAIDQLVRVLPNSNSVWGGDWNQNLVGGWQNVGSADMRKRVEAALTLLDLKVTTAELLFQTGSDQNTIDHIAVPKQWTVRPAKKISAVGLSDHDAYVVEIDEL